MSETLFISDLHLCQECETTFNIFNSFLEIRAVKANALYILGDLFDRWVGDDDTNAFNMNCIEALARVVTHGVDVFIQHGNRDFLIGKSFAELTGCTLLPDIAVIQLFDAPVLIMHGDTLCTDDVAYQHVRKQVHDPIWQAQFMAKSVMERHQLAKQYRQESGSHQKQTLANKMDVNQDEVINIMAKYRVDTLIHGHTHCPGTYAFDDHSGSKQRIVLGDWYSTGYILSKRKNKQFCVEILS